MIILFAYKKGGTMKSTLACSLAAYLAEKNSVMIVDTDKDQYTARNWVMDREEEGFKPAISCITAASGDGLADTLQAIDAKFDYVIVDGHGGDTSANRASLTVCDVALAPLAPTQVDLDTLKPWLSIFDTAKRINKKNVKLISVITQYTSQSKIDQAREYLAHFPEYRLLENAIKFRSGWQGMPAGKGAGEMNQKANAAMKNEFIAVAKEFLEVIK